MKNWQQSGNNYFLRDITNQVPELPVSVYSIHEDAFLNLSLESRFEKFSFSHKIYGKDHTFIKRVLKTYHNTTGNLGVLLNGIKGTGKSVTAKLLCNELNLPVIVVDSNYENLVSFLSEIQQDVVVLLDEYEKIYKDSATLLGAMDGIDASTFRRTFILTTNDIYVNTNMLNRPGRIRYLKNYNNLDIETVKEIIDDLLVYRNYESDLLDTLRDMTHITVDLVISIIQEINIHNEPASSFTSIFNVDFKNPHFDIFEEDGVTEFVKNVKIPYGRNVSENPKRWINHDIYYEDIEGETALIGTYRGYKDGLWTFENDEVEPKIKNLIIRKAVTVGFYAYEK